MKNLGAGSHAPWLALLASRTIGSVVEFGIGAFSTPLLHVMIAMQGRKLQSYETDLQWFNDYLPLAGPNHQMAFIKDWRNIDYESGWDIAFVDCSPAADERQDVSPRVEIIKRLKGRARFIVAHDTEADIPPSAGDYRWRELNGLFQYQTVLDKFRPWTTVYSDVEEFKA